MPRYSKGISTSAKLPTPTAFTAAAISVNCFLTYPSTVELEKREFLTLWYEFIKLATPAILRTARYKLS